MMNNKYANYVVQRAFDKSTREKQEVLIAKIETVVASGAVNPKKAHAKHVIEHLEKKHKINVLARVCASHNHLSFDCSAEDKTSQGKS